MMGKVWVVNRLNKDVPEAAQWGTLTAINFRYVFADNLEEDETIPLQFRAKMEQAAAQFDFTNDYLLLAGDDLQLAQFVAILSRYLPNNQKGGFRVLRWDRQAQGYYPVRIDF